MHSLHFGHIKINALPRQPHPIISYFRVGKLLYYSLALFILESWIYWIQLKAAYMGSSTVITLFWLWSFLFSFVHIYLVVMDGWSRYQNYKRAKDQLYIHGFRPRIAHLYIGSKCQRMAAIVAANELGIGDRLKEYYKKKGVKWYHYAPYFMIKDPLFLFKKYFWKRTFMEKNYISKFDFRKIQLEFSV